LLKGQERRELLGAINYNNSLGFLLTFLLASMGVMRALSPEPFSRSCAQFS
jgi:hypothetical protein